MAMRMLRKLTCTFSSKKAPFFWNEINPCVKEAEYAVRGVVPTLANTIQTELKKGSTGTNLHTKPTPSTKLPSATSAILNSSTKSPSLSIARSFPAWSTQISSTTNPLISTPATALKKFQLKLSVQAAIPILLVFPQSEKVSQDSSQNRTQSPSLPSMISSLLKAPHRGFI